MLDLFFDSDVKHHKFEFRKEIEEKPKNIVRKSNFNLSESFYRSYFDNNVKVYKLYDNSNEIGQTIWIKSSISESKRKVFRLWKRI